MTSISPSLDSADRIRVWIPPQTFFSRSGDRRIAGQLLSYAPSDSVVVRRSRFRPLWEPRDVVVYWMDVHRLDVPHGRNTLGGMAQGAGVVGGMVLTVAFYCRIWGGVDCIKQGWQLSRRMVFIAIPAGAVYGFFSTRWKRVY